MMGIDTPQEYAELALSIAVALYAVYAMQRVACSPHLTRRQICLGRGALALLAAGAGLSGTRPLMDVASPQILILVPLLLVLIWVAVTFKPGGAPCARRPGSPVSSQSPLNRT